MFVVTCCWLVRGSGGSVLSCWDWAVLRRPEDWSQSLHRLESLPQIFKHTQTQKQTWRGHDRRAVSPRRSSRGQSTCSVEWSCHILSEGRWQLKRQKSPCGSAPPPDGGGWRCRSTPGGSPSCWTGRKEEKKQTINEHEVEQHNKTKYTNQIFYFYYLILIISSNINLTSSSSSTGSTDTDCTSHHSRSHYSLFSPLTLVSTLSFSSFVHCPSPWIFDPVSLTSLTFTTHLYFLQVYSPPHT